MVGVGAIAEAIVTGLCADGEPSILLSPRGAERARRLADRHASVDVAGSNAAVVDGAELVLLCLRPQDAAEALPGLPFRAEQTVISLLAGVSLDALTRLVAPAHSLARAIPLPAVAERAGLTAIHPADERTYVLFDTLGEVIVAPGERALDALSAATATIAAHLAYLGAISRWLARQGIDRAEASRYVAAIFDGLAGEFDAVAADHATPGGINEQFLAALRDAGTFAVVDRALDDVMSRLRGSAEVDG